jgi:hypothetical protein
MKCIIYEIFHFHVHQDVRFNIVHVLLKHIQHFHFELWILPEGKFDPLNILLENIDYKWGICFSTLDGAQI